MRTTIKTIIMIAHFVGLLALVSPALAVETITGRASVIDGDTIEIHGERIRLDGIDAPESWQSCEGADGEPYPCGRRAADALDGFLAVSRPTRCETASRDRYGRHVAVCARADGVEANAWLVEQGHALDWPRYSKGRYKAQQDAAEAARRGMWQGDFVEPWDARKLRR